MLHGSPATFYMHVGGHGDPIRMAEGIRAALSHSKTPMTIGVPSAAVLEVPDVMEHPHTKHRGMVWEKDGWRNVGNPVKLSRTPPKVRTKPKKFGTDTKAVLAEVGYSPAEVDKLVASGIAFIEIKK